MFLRAVFPGRGAIFHISACFLLGDSASLSALLSQVVLWVEFSSLVGRAVLDGVIVILGFIVYGALFLSPLPFPFFGAFFAFLLPAPRPSRQLEALAPSVFIGVGLGVWGRWEFSACHCSPPRVHMRLIRHYY